MNPMGTAAIIRNASDDQHRPQHGAGKPVLCVQRGGVRAHAEPRAVPERHEPRVADQDVERHARDGEDHDVGRAGERETAGQQRERQHDHRSAAITDRERNSRIHSKRWMRSPKSPRGRTSSTSTISRYIEASAAAG